MRTEGKGKEERITKENEGKRQERKTKTKEKQPAIIIDVFISC